MGKREQQRTCGFITDLQVLLSPGCAVRYLPHLPTHPLIPAMEATVLYLAGARNLPGPAAVKRVLVSPSLGRAAMG